MIDLSHLKIQVRPIGEIIPFAGNARTHSAEQVAQVVKSIQEFGWTNPILVGADSVIIAGHARLEAARTLKMTEVPVIVLPHLSEAQRRALVIADNQLALGAGWDDDILREQLQSLQEDDFDLDLLGFSDEELVSLMKDPERLDEGQNDADETPEPPTNPVSRPGDMWLLGPHRLLVGDATSSADVARLIGSDHADLVFTDPPYGVDYQGYTKDRLKIQGDKMTPERFKQFLADVFASYRTLIKDGASMYVCHSSSWQREFQTALEAAGFEVRCQIIWAKNTFAWGFG
ncbi:MAG: ParB N-terminal domain-containing protein, partial [Terracidiphilus sp.]|nr:ParB N-terminal domain-containing protein [Terracidiphilus sp.]